MYVNGIFRSDRDQGVGERVPGLGSGPSTVVISGRGILRRG